jgi:hypothetical protein
VEEMTDQRKSPDIEELATAIQNIAECWKGANGGIYAIRGMSLELAKTLAPCLPGPAQKEKEPVMCIGWPTIKRLAAGEAVWFESLGCGAVAASDLHGADIDAILSQSSTDREGK